jgi:hypothetical protein
LLQIFAGNVQHSIMRFFYISDVAAQTLLQNKLLYVLFMRQESLVVLALSACFLTAMFVIRDSREGELEPAARKNSTEPLASTLVTCL